MYASLVIISVLSILASSGIAAPVPGHRHRPATAATSVLSGPELAASCAARPDKGEGDFFGGGPCAFVTDKPPATALATTTPIVVAAPIATTKAATAATSVLSGPELAASCAARPDKGEGDFFGGGPCAFVTDKPPATALATTTPIVVAAPIATTKAATAATSVLSGPELAASCAARPDKGEGDFFGGGPCAFVTDKPPATAVATATPTVPAAPIATTKAATATTARSADEIAASCAARPDKGEGDFFGGGPCAFVN